MFLLSSVILIGSLAVALGDLDACNYLLKVPNIAKYGEASQESNYECPRIGCANAAIDGDRNSDYYQGSCTQTNGQNDPWWKLDLKQIYNISHIVITNRQDCCAERLLEAQIQIGNSPDNDNPVCATVTSVEDESLRFCCFSMIGRYISVVISGRAEYLSLCEVEVYGDLFDYT